jgi:hypothetical protein
MKEVWKANPTIQQPFKWDFEEAESNLILPSLLPYNTRREMKSRIADIGESTA